MSNLNWKRRVVERMRSMRAALPTSMHVNTTVQLYIADGTITTRVTLPNFVSFFAPDRRIDCTYRLKVFTEDGREAGSTDVLVFAYGAADVDLQRIFGGKLSRFGMFSAKMSLRPFYSYRGHHLGTLTPQVLTLYKAGDDGAMALIHCVCKFDQRPAHDLHWRSTLPIDVSKLEAMEIYQINPSAEVVRSELFLEDMAGNKIVSDQAEVTPRSTRRVSFPKDQFIGHSLVRFGAVGLTARNAKPLVFMRFANGSFSGQHP